MLDTLIRQPEPHRSLIREVEAPRTDPITMTIGIEGAVRHHMVAARWDHERKALLLV